MTNIKETNDARNCLPENMKKDFDDIVNQVVLGASTHIKMIAQMIEETCKDSIELNQTTSELLTRIQTICTFFIKTRGEASQAITNAILLMTKDIEKQKEAPVDLAGAVIIETKENYLKSVKKTTQNVVKYATAVANRYQTILVFDYSSTVEAMLRNLKHSVNVYIAESRVINGGYPFVKACIESNHKIKFIPDASLMYYMQDCDAAFMGAETILPDGTGYNTTGSDIVGLLCDYYKIPLYFVSPLIKLDTRYISGKEKKLVINNLENKLGKVANPNQLKYAIDYTTPELIGVEPKFITAFISEVGVIPSNQMYFTSIKYMENIGGDLHV